MQAAQWERGDVALWESQGGHHLGVECVCRPRSGHHLRRHSRSIPRPQGAVSNWWIASGDQLLVYGRLCRQRLLLSWDCHFACLSKSQIQRSTDHPQRQSRVPSDHSSVSFKSLMNISP
jgi:hypothetical protein